MIIELEIENFRGFSQSKFTGFGRINLIGGQNNVGKTAFLEALYLNHSPQVSTLMQLRGINQEVITAFPARAWDNLFLNQQKNATIRIKSLSEENISDLLTISVGYSSLIDQESWSEILLHDEESKISRSHAERGNACQDAPRPAKKIFKPWINKSGTFVWRLIFNIQ